MFRLVCQKCGATGWAPGEFDPETNCTEVDVEWEGGDSECDHWNHYEIGKEEWCSTDS